MNLTIERLNGQTYSLLDYNIKTLDFVIDSPSPRTESEVIEGQGGHVDLGTTYEGRSLRGSFFMSALEQEYSLSRNEVFRMLDSREAFYLMDDREPGKRWLVKVSSGYSMEQIRNFGRFEVEFISSSPYAESSKTTTEMTNAQISGWPTIAYKHSASAFEIYNEGDVDIDPSELPLVITYKGASTNLSITNVTTGVEWAYTGTTTASDSIVLDGIRSTKNGLSIFAKTNRKLLTLAKGWNSFELTGASGTFEITFDFRFYTL